jgi:hypothetical protein
VYLAITIDTEEDNWGEFTRSSYSVENIRRIPRLQALLEKRGVVPTYLISYPVATSTAAIDILGRYREEGRCEIGAHPHPWNTPPLEEERTPANSFISHLPTELQYRKLKTLHDTITQNFGAAPRSYRSGRWGFSDDIARHLIRLGYLVDTSLSPATDWGEYGGPDYSDRCLDPFVYVMPAQNGFAGGTLLEVPATVGFVQSQPALATAYWTIRRKVPAGDKVLAALSRTRLLNHVSLSPELHDAAHMIRLVRALLARGTTVVNMFFHSPSLLEGCSPFVRTAADAEDFLERIDRFLVFAQSAGLRPVTMSELTPAAVGASAARELPFREVLVEVKS